MSRYRNFSTAALAAAAAMVGIGLAYADFEVTSPDGRRILLRDDGRWRYIEPQTKPAGTDAKPAEKAEATAAADKEAKAGDADAADKGAKDPKAAKDGDKGVKSADAKEADKDKKDAGEAVLTLERKIEGNRICRFGLRMVNNLPYEIRSIVPEFRAYRSNGVVYDAVFGSFQFIKPGDSQTREVRFDGIGCPDIARVQVAGGDRCEMGELDKFSPVKGKCLGYVRLVESNLVRFDK